MSGGFAIYAEGDSDCKFLKALLTRLKIDYSDQTIAQIGGIDKLPTLVSDFASEKAAGNCVALVLDANANFSRRRAKVERMVEEHGLQVDRTFLLPNDKDEGCLESLLEYIVAPEHRGILDCFAQYEACLENLDNSYKTPNPKAKIFAYCEANGIETKATKRTYGKPPASDKRKDESPFWDMDSPHLEPLKKFLCEVCNATF